MFRLLFFVFVFLLFPNFLKGQISPPGLGNTNAAVWTAFGVRQSLEPTGQWQSFSYFGLGRISNPDTYNPVEKPAIIVINEEVYNQFRPRWQYSLALSYRYQNEYIDTIPYTADLPEARREFRIYSRLTYNKRINKFRFAATARQEFRKFYTPDFKNWEETYQLRSRLRGQLTFFIDQGDIHRLVLSAEALFAAGRKLEPKPQWSDFTYRESRISFYYSFNPENLPFSFNVGYMNNLVGTSDLHIGHYIAADIILLNPSEFFKGETASGEKGLE